MGTTTLSKDKLINICFIAITCIVFLTTLDLIYGFAKQSVIALICSSLSGLIVFIGAYIKKRNQIEKGIDKTMDFIYSNFNCASIILSALDIVCSIIAVLTSLYWFTMVFRALFGVRLLCITNKFKTVIKPFISVIIKYISVIRFLMVSSFIYIYYRFIKKNRREIKMSEIKVKAEKLSLKQWLAIAGGVLGVAVAIVSLYVPQVQIFGDLTYNILIGLGITGLSGFLGTYSKYKTKTEEQISVEKEKN